MNRRNAIRALVAAGAAGGGSILYLNRHTMPGSAVSGGHSEPTSREFPIRFADATARAGISFHHNTGAFGKKYLPETLGSGCAFLDYDNDGWLDILLINGMDWPGHERAPSTMKLYHNNRNGTFTDVTQAAGL